MAGGAADKRQAAATALVAQEAPLLAIGHGVAFRVVAVCTDFISTPLSLRYSEFILSNYMQVQDFRFRKLVVLHT